MSEYAQPVLKKSKWFAFIWSIPLLTAVVASFLLFNYYQNRGVAITIDFTSGSGLVAGKTKIRYEGIDIGQVESISLIKGEKKVRVHARLHPSATYLACRGSLFWVVQARFSSGGVSGLDTILSGKYISMRPAEGEHKPRTRFIGLDHPPMGDERLPGLFISLKAKKLSSLTAGTAVLYKQIKVGQVEGSELLENNEVKIFLYIEPEFCHLVRTTTRFWNAGGIRVSGGLSGFKVRTESVAAMLTGGVTFDTPETNLGEPAERGQEFALYHDRDEALSGVVPREDIDFHPGIIIKVSFANAEGIVSGKTVVKYKGIAIGKVLGRAVSADLATVDLTIMLHPKAGEATRAGTRFWVVKPSFGSQGISGLSTLVDGRYIEVRPGTGEKTDNFIGLEKPPLTENGDEGLHIRLVCENAQSVSTGSPILYRNIEVGRVAGIALARDGGSVEVYGLLFAEYKHLVKDTSRFWNSSGVKIKADMGGVELQIGSLASLITGGLEFDTPVGTGQAVDDCMIFTLYPGEDEALEWGRRIRVSFQSARDLSVGADLRFKGVRIGEVKDIRLSKTMDSVVAEIHVDEAHVSLLRQGTKFWVVRPAVGLMGVEHLGTILRGGYVEIEPGHGSGRATRFTGLEHEPLSRVGSLELILTCSRLGALQAGSPVFYRNIQAGRVLETGLVPDGKGVEVRLMIEPKFTHLVGDKTLFYRSGGMHVNASLAGVEVEVESIAAILNGGVSFANEEEPGHPLSSLSRVPLYASYGEGVATGREWKTFVLQTKQTGSLTAGRPVYYRGVEVGQVLGVALGRSADHVLVTIGLELEYAPLVRKTSLFWNASGIGLDVSLLGGAKMRTQSMEAILAGGVAFINPEDTADVAPAGTLFVLHEKPEERWLNYQRKVPGFE